MKELDGYISELVNFNKNLSSHIESIVLNNKGMLLQKLKLRLYNYGVDGSGNKIEPPYDASTIAIKKKNSQRSSHVTLRDTGMFYASMYVEFHKDTVSIFSSDYKTDLLTTKYGDDILELTDLEQEWFILSFLEPEIQKIIDSINSKNVDIV